MKKGQTRSNRTRFVFPSLIGERLIYSDELFSTNSDVAHRFAQKRKKTSTAAEQEFKRILNSVAGGVFAGTFEREWAICGKWILDFYFPKYRLAIEVDGNYHNSPGQIKKDLEKAADCEKLEITLLRLNNSEIFGDRKQLLEKLEHYLKLAADKAESCTKKLPASPEIKDAKAVKSIIRLSEREQLLIKNHFEFYKSLANGKRVPTTAEQQHFVAVCQGLAAPETEHEIAFSKFIRIQLSQIKKKKL